MKTVFIYDQLKSSIKFFVKDGDYSHLHSTYINSMLSECDLVDELTSILYDTATWEVIVDLQDTFPTNLGNQFKVIVVGFLP